MLIGFGIIALIVSFNLRRANKNISFELSPNCLMTKYPIFFVPGKFSFFYFLKYWNNIPIFLKEHGYEVNNLAINMSYFVNKKKYITNHLKNKNSFHLFFDRSELDLAIELSEVLKKQNHKFHMFLEPPEEKLIEKKLSNNKFIQVHKIQTEKLSPIYKDDFNNLIYKTHQLIIRKRKHISFCLLGIFSNGDQLTGDPEFLRITHKIAESDWE